MLCSTIRPLAGLLLVAAAAACTEGPAQPTVAERSDPNLSSASLGLSPFSGFGMNANPCHGGGDPTCLARELDVARDAGVKWMRLTIYWDEMQPWGATETDPNLHPVVLANMQRTVNMANARGISATFTIHTTPGWARLCGHPDVPNCGGRTSPPHDAMWVWWARFVATMADQFPTVTHFAIWNEPNSPAFFTPHPGHTRLDDYRTLVAYAAAPLHDRGRYVVAGETAPLGSSDPQGDMRPFIRELYRSHGHMIDVIGVHHYGKANDIISWVNEVPRLMDQAGRPRVPVWLTEFGHGVEEAGDADQAAVLTKVMDAMNGGSQPQWHKAFPFSMNFTGYRLVDFHSDGIVNYIRPGWGCYTAVALNQTRPTSCSYYWYH